MSTIGVDLTAAERWEQGRAECGEDFCDTCGECIGCSGEPPCYDTPFTGERRHVWVNPDTEEARLV